MKAKLGDKVRLIKPTEVYYSNYGGRPVIKATPEMVGVVAAVKVPSVRREGVFFNCVDFEINGRVERVAARNDQIVRAR